LLQEQSGVESPAVQRKHAMESLYIDGEQFRNGERVGCSLDWVKGPYMDEE
jgi:hypothetical protein